MIFNFLSITGWLVAAGSWAGLLVLHYPRPNLVGEQTMGYALGLFLCCIGFLVGLLMMASIFIWREALSLPVALIPLAGALAIALTTFFCGVLLTEPAPWIQGPLRWLASAGGLIWIPAITLAATFIWVIPILRETVPLRLWQWSLGFTSGISVLALLGYFLTWLAAMPERHKAELEAHKQEEATRHNQYLEELATWQPENGLLPILALTGRFHDDAVRLAAVDRIRSVADWGLQLIKLLESEGHYYHVYPFIDGNAIEHPSAMIPSLNGSIRRMALDIQMEIHDANNLQHWTFDYLGIERLTRAIDEQFSSHKAILVPTLWEVYYSFQAKPPERFKGVTFDAARQLNQWLDKQDKTFKSR